MAFKTNPKYLGLYLYRVTGEPEQVHTCDSISVLSGREKLFFIINKHGNREYIDYQHLLASPTVKLTKPHPCLTRKYVKYEFCEAMKCDFLEINECYAVSPLQCPYTAKQFHKWLQNNNFEIVKKGK